MESKALGGLGVLALMMGVSTFALAPTAAAQTSDTAAAPETEIVVTARRVQESLQTTPVAVTALTAETLSRTGMAQITDLQRAAPSLSTASGGPGGPGVAFLSIRGQINTNANSASDPAVATYVDGVYYARPTSGNFGFLDPAQVEVLRGPQGTLFGRNTTGGALNISTVVPGGDFEGYVRADAGDYNMRRLDAAVTIPMMGDEVSLRLAGRTATRDGYVDNPVTGREMQDIDLSWAGRATLRVAPDSLPFDVTLRFDRLELRDNGQAIASRGINAGLTPLAGAGIFTSIGDLFTAQGLTPSSFIYGQGARFDQSFQNPQTFSAEVNNPNDEAQQEGVSATVDFELGSWAVKTILAWRQANSANSQDLDGTPVRLLAFASRYEQDQESYEFQATNTFGNLDLIFGGYYFQEEGTEQSISEAFGAFPPPFGGGNLSLDLSDFESDSTGVFVQGNYRFTDALRATIGYRYTWDNRAIDRHGLASIQANLCAPPIPLTPTGCSLPLDAEFSYPAWTAGLDFEATDDLFLYAKTSRASLAGGFNTRVAPTGAESFEPETVTDVELGAKLEAFDDRLRLNLAVFHSETEDAQRVTNGILLGRLSQWVQNTGDVETDGVELEVRAVPWRGMEFTSGIAYLDSRFKSGSFLEDRGPVFGGVVDRSGEPIQLVPELSYNVGLTQEFDFSFGVASFHVNYAWVDDKAGSPSTANANATPAQIASVATANRLTTLDAYGLLNANATLYFENGVELGVWGQNLTDEEYFLYAFDGYNSLGFATQNQGTPRVYGIRLGYQF